MISMLDAYLILLKVSWVKRKLKIAHSLHNVTFVYMWLILPNFQK